MSNRLRLVLLSFLMLFVELSLIRWLGSDVFYLSYFSNFVLLGSFLGIGIGFLRANSRFALFSYAPLALAVLVGFVLRFPVQVDRSGSDLIFFGGSLTPSDRGRTENVHGPPPHDRPPRGLQWWRRSPVGSSRLRR